jgi:hypothetical protein
MGVQVNQAGKNGESGPIKPFRPLWRRAARSEGRYLVVGDADALIGEDGASPNIHELSRCHIQVGRMQWRGHPG